MNKLFFVFLVITALSGCGSEVDKCVISQVKGWKAQQERVKDFTKNLFDSPVINDTRTEAEVEAEARIVCLKANGKN